MPLTAQWRYLILVFCSSALPRWIYFPCTRCWWWMDVHKYADRSKWRSVNVLRWVRLVTTCIPEQRAGWGSRRHQNTCKQKIATQDALVSILTDSDTSFWFQLGNCRGNFYIRCLMSPHFPFSSTWIIEEIQNCWPTIPAGLARTASISGQTTMICSRNTGNISFEYLAQLQRMWIFFIRTLCFNVHWTMPNPRKNIGSDQEIHRVPILKTTCNADVLFPNLEQRLIVQ
jgi:hypothetical protein